jgi:hypothetical protein
LAVTLVGISLLFIACQSVKIITDVYELFFCAKVSSFVSISVCCYLKETNIEPC